MRDASRSTSKGLLEDGQPIPVPSALTVTYVEVAG
jgi:hypothetical protein